MSAWKFKGILVFGILLAACGKDDKSESYVRETRILEADLDAETAAIRTSDDLEASERRIFNELVWAYIDGGETEEAAKRKAATDFAAAGRTPPP
jgi:hypothetical protein